MDAILFLIGVGSLLAALYFMIRGRGSDYVIAALLAVLTVLIGGILAVNSSTVTGEQCSIVTGPTEVQSCVYLTAPQPLYSSLGAALIGVGMILVIAVIVLTMAEGRL
ncbi:MAG: hypothetical protein ACP5NY_04065 [Thermocladium sp.]